MNRLLQLVSLAIDALKARASHVAELESQSAEKDAIIADLKAKLDAGSIADAGLQKRVDAAESRAAELEQLSADAVTAQNELAEALNSEPAVPSVDPGTFEVTAPAEQAASGSADQGSASV